MDDAAACPICFSTMNEPMLATCCGRSFCRACLDEALDREKACPLCRAPLFTRREHYTVVRNRTLGELLLSMSDRRVGQQDAAADDEATDYEDEDEVDDHNDAESGDEIDETEILALDNDDSESEPDAADRAFFHAVDDDDEYESAEGAAPAPLEGWPHGLQWCATVYALPSPSLMTTRPQRRAPCSNCRRRIRSDPYWPYRQCHH